MVLADHAEPEGSSVPASDPAHVTDRLYKTTPCRCVFELYSLHFASLIRHEGDCMSPPEHTTPLTPQAEMTALTTALQQIGPPDHLCSIYENQQEYLAVAVAFMRIGLARGEKCIYIADDGTENTVRGAMRAGGIEVERAVASNALVFMHKEQAYLTHGTFDPDWMFTFWKAATSQAMSEGCPVLRITGETQWVLRGGAGLQRWMEYESRLTHVFAETNFFALCQYNRQLFPPELILDVIRTHPTVIFRGTVCRNMYHVPAEAFLGTDTSAREAERLLTNIQERAQVEQALRVQRDELRNSELRSRLLVEGVKDYALFMLDTEGRVTSWNAGAERVKGYAAQEILGQHCSRFYRPEDVARGIPDEGLRLAATSGRFETEGWRVRKDGSWFWAHVVVTALKHSTGELYAFAKMTRDITERKESAALLREAHERLVMILDSIQDNFFGLSKDWRFTYLNNHAKEQMKVLGKDPERLIGKVLWEEFPEVPNEEALRRVMSERVSITDELYYPPLGEWVENHMYPSEDGGLVTFQRYITERKGKEEELCRSEAYLAEAQRLSHTGTWAWNISSGELFWSLEHFRILGLDPARVKPSYPTAVQWIHPEDRSLAQQTLEKAGHEKSDFEHECRIIRPDGTVRHIYSFGRPVFNESGELTNYVGTIMDITERKLAEAQLRMLSGRLLQAQDDERRRLARELHDSTAQTLTGLSLQLGVVGGEVNTLSPRARRALADSVDLIGQASRELSSLSYLLHPPFLDESGLGSAVAWLVDGFSQRSGIKVETHIPSDMGRLPQEIETTVFRIIQECLTNILKHSGSQTASLRISLDTQDIVLEVKDQGRGLVVQSLGRPSSVSSGVGIGIMGMRERVRQLHGRLDIDSGEWGTQVTATLPLAMGLA
jgi:PAS domain S-box-containing protein